MSLGIQYQYRIFPLIYHQIYSAQISPVSEGMEGEGHSEIYGACIVFGGYITQH